MWTNPNRQTLSMPYRPVVEVSRLGDARTEGRRDLFLHFGCLYLFLIPLDEASGWLMELYLLSLIDWGCAWMLSNMLVRMDLYYPATRPV